MKTTKRVLSVLLSLALTLTGLAALCVSAHAAYKTGDIIEFGCYPQSLAKDNVNLHNAALKAQFKSYRYIRTPEYRAKLFTVGSRMFSKECTTKKGSICGMCIF